MGEGTSRAEGTPFATIYQAASRGRIETLKVLLESGANPDEADQCGAGTTSLCRRQGPLGPRETFAGERRNSGLGLWELYDTA